MISILFYVDNDPKSGAGHLVRSCRLAAEFQRRNCKVSFATSSELIPMPFLTEVQSINFVKFDPNQKYDLIVIDNYALKKEDHDGFYKQTNKILVLDDLCNRPVSCDFLWDPTLTRKLDDYHDYVSDNSKLFLGGKYQIFSDKHIRVALRYDEKKRLSSNAIHLYGGQTGNMDLSDLCLALSKNFKINVLGDMYEKIPNVPKNVTLTRMSKNPIETFWDCKIGVGSPGNMLWERGSIGIPSFVLINNSNQARICADLHAAGFLELGQVNQGVASKSQLKNIEKLFHDSAKLEKMSKKLSRNINVCGKRLLVEELLQVL